MLEKQKNPNSNILEMNSILPKIDQMISDLETI